MPLSDISNIHANITFKKISLYEEDRNMTGYSDIDYGFYFDQNQEDEDTLSSRDVLSIILSILGIFANIFSIFIINRIHMRLTTHLKLIISLCVSDCLILIPSLLKTFVIMTHGINVCFNVAARLMTDLALLASLLNLLAIAIDHYLAILKPLFYKKSMTHIRGICVVLVIWVASMLAISVEIIVGMIHKKETGTLCVAIAYDEINSEVGIVSFIFVVLFVIFVIYARVYVCVHRNRETHSRIRHRQRDTSNIKALVTTSLFVLTFVLFWTPVGIFHVYVYNVDENYIKENLDDIIQAGEIVNVVLLLNTITDPIIYTFRLPQVHRRCFTFKTKIRRQSTKMVTFRFKEVT